MQIPPADEQRHELARPLVLLISKRSQLALELHRQGFEVDARRSEDVLLFGDERRPAAVVVDLLSDLAGVHAVRDVRAELPGLPVLLLTDGDMGTGLASSVGLPARVLEMPVAAGALRQALRELLIAGRDESPSRSDPAESDQAAADRLPVLDVRVGLPDEGHDQRSSPHPPILQASGDVEAVAEQLAADLASSVLADAAAVLVRDGAVWRVAGHHRARALETQLVLRDDSWLVEKVVVACRILAVADTDMLRQQLSSVPLASRRSLIALPCTTGVLALVGRDRSAFTVHDVRTLRRVCSMHPPLRQGQWPTGCEKLDDLPDVGAGHGGCLIFRH